MAFGVVQTRDTLASAGGEIAMDELDEAVEVFGRDCIVLLVEVVDVAVQDLDEELDGHGRVHAGVGDAEGTLQAFEDAFAVAVGLVRARS